jgi:hypothetical protein
MLARDLARHLRLLGRRGLGAVELEEQGGGDGKLSSLE